MFLNSRRNRHAFAFEMLFVLLSYGDKNKTNKQKSPRKPGYWILPVLLFYVHLFDISNVYVSPISIIICIAYTLYPPRGSSCLVWSPFWSFAGRFQFTTQLLVAHKMKIKIASRSYYRRKHLQKVRLGLQFGFFGVPFYNEMRIFPL